LLRAQDARFDAGHVHGSVGRPAQRGEQMDFVWKVVDEAAGLLRSFRAYRRAYFMSRDFRQRS
jgi:hypothetical protein